MVLRAVVVAHHRRYSHRIAEEYGQEHHICVHQHPEGRHAVFACHLHQLQVINHTHKREGHVGDKFRHSVNAGAHQRPGIRAIKHLNQGAQTQPARLPPAQKVEKRDHSAHNHTDYRGDGGTLDAPTEEPHEHIIQHNVGTACGKSHPHPHFGPLCRNHQGLECPLQYEKGHRKGQDAAIAHAVFEQLAVGPQQPAHGAQGGECHQPGNYSGRNGAIDNSRKIALSLVLIPLSHHFGYQRAAARAEHKAQASPNLDVGPDYVDPRKGGLAGIV